MRAYIVTDLGFGDSGKGLLTDFLVRHLNAGVVVRYNGGAQAGHNVVTSDGRHHTFSQFGSGTFNPAVKTYLSRYVVIHPGALLIEGKILEKKGVQDPFSRLRISDQALVITPFHQAANRTREVARGPQRHGSCGVGVGEAAEDALLGAEHRVMAGDLSNPTMLRRKLRTIREHKHEQLSTLRKENSHNSLFAREWEVFEGEDVIDLWISSIARINELDLVTSDSVLEHWLHNAETAVFEGAQGVLLDAERGFHPYTTWSCCTGANAFELIEQLASDAQVFQIGVIRSYAVRHGPGPLPTETDALSTMIDEHNKTNEWQGRVRYGWFDSVLTRYALDITGKVDALTVTHLDLLPHLTTWKYCPGYRTSDSVDHSFVESEVPGDVLTNFRLPASLSLEKRADFTQSLSTVTPVFETCDADDETVLDKIESLTGQQIGMVSRGSSAKDIQMLQPLPT